MQPLTLSIPGKYYDSYLVSDRLYLVSDTGMFTLYSWSQIVTLLVEKYSEPLISTLLSGSLADKKIGADSLLSDHKVREALKKRLQEVADVQMVIEPEMLTKARRGEQQFPLEFPYASFEVYRDVAYVAGSTGVHALSVRPGLKNLFSTRPPATLFDCPAFHMSIGWGTMIISAGAYGLIEASIRGYGQKSIYREYVTRHGWIGGSLFAHSPNPTKSAFLVHTLEGGLDRGFDHVIDEHDLLGNVNASWGEYNRICGLTDDSVIVRAVEFRHFDPQPHIHAPREIAVPITAPFVSAANSSFGTVIETDKELVVIDSEMQVSRLEVEPSNWRIYKRGRYDGFLGIALSDRLVQLVFPDLWFPPNTVGDKTATTRSARRDRPRAA